MLNSISKIITFADAGTAVEVGNIPPNSIIVDIKVTIGTAFNSSGTDLVDVGTSADDDHFAAAVDVSSAGQATVTQLNNGAVLSSTASTPIEALYAQSVADADAGSGYVTVVYDQL